MTAALLDREEYIEQAYFFCHYRERLLEAVPSQEILVTIREEILATTNLPLAIDFMTTEVLHSGCLSASMSRLPHYFTPFQTFVMQKSEEENSKFDQTTALLILERQAKYLSQQPNAAGLFMYQFESLARNRLGYDYGMLAISEDPLYDDIWSQWIRSIRHQLGHVDFADLIYRHSEFYSQQQTQEQQPNLKANSSMLQPLFGLQEGRIANANRNKDPLYMFAALQRQLGYPAVPRPKRKSTEPLFTPPVEQRFYRLEQRVKLLEGELKGTFDLDKFLKENPPVFDDDD